MPDTEDRLFDLLDQWALLHKQGKDVLVHELCRDCPELVDELERRIATLRATDWLDQPLEDSRDEPIKNKPPDFGLPDHLGRYRLHELIGAGGFGQVWRGFDPELQRAVAIKIPRPDRVSTPERIERFIEEARRVAQLKHPGIVPIHDVGREGDRCFIVSGLIDGKNLAEDITSSRPSQEDACRIVAEIARILQHAHQCGFVHRDVKPANILLDDQGKVFLTDFGIAATLDEKPTSSVGTLSYMAPEQVAGQPVDARSDIYSLGVVLFEMLTGNRLIDSSNPAKARDEIGSGKAVARLETAECPTWLKFVCRKCLATEPQDRFSTADELANALRRPRRHFDLRRVFLLALVVAAVVGLFLWPNKPDYGSQEIQQTAAKLVEARQGRFQIDGQPEFLARLEQFSDRFGIIDVFLRETDTTDDDLAVLAKVPTITSLNVAITPVTDAGLRHISGMKNLRALRLNNTKVTDAGMVHLVPLELELLELRDTSITDAALAQLGKMTSLKKLTLVGTGVTDGGLSELYGLPKLEELRVGRTTVTEAGAKALREKLPNCKVVR